METKSATQQALKIVDCDVHVTPKDGVRSLLPYMTKAWSTQFETFARLKREVKRHPFRYPNPSGAINRWDAVPPSGGEPGSDLEYLQVDLLQKWHISEALLVPVEWVNAWTDPRLASAYLSALNDYFIQEWLPADNRLRYALVVSPHDPVSAAAEIRRHAGSRHVGAVFLPLLNLMMGHTWFNPVYEAAQETDLPVVSHATGGEGTYQGAPTLAGGVPQTYAERNVSNFALGMANTVNMVFEGVFERYPKLRVVFIEWGFTWLPSTLWRMDKRWRELRSEIPWVRRPPSEYVFEHLRYTTQPVDGPDNQEEFVPFLKAMRAEQTLLFSTDYPHWDNDDPFKVFTGLPQDLKRRIYSENALETFGQRFQ